MRTFFDHLLRSAADVSGAGGGADPAASAAAAAAGSGAAPASGDQSSAAPNAAGASGDASSAQADPAAAAAAASAAPQLYRPDGLPENLLGKSDQETIDNQLKALKGYRDRDAGNQVPETPEAYSAFPDELPAEIKPHLDALKADPLFSRIAEKALALKLPVPAYQGLVQEFLSVSAEMGLMEPVVDVAAEKAALLPDSAKHLPETEQKQAIERRMNTNFAFLDAMVARGAANGGFAKDDADFAKAMLGDSAKGHRIFEWMARTSGGTGSAVNMQQTQPAGANSDREALRQRAGLPQNTIGDPKFNKASYDQLEKDYQKVIGS